VVGYPCQDTNIIDVTLGPVTTTERLKPDKKGAVCKRQRITMLESSVFPFVVKVNLTLLSWYYYDKVWNDVLFHVL